MIIDSLKNCGLYCGLHPLFGRVFRYLEETDLLSLPDGRYDIDGSDIFATLTLAPLRSAPEAPLEVHDRYIDIQLVLENEEIYGWRERPSCTRPRGDMDPQGDILFFDDPHRTHFKLQAGEFCIFFPTDAHAPLIGDTCGQVKKCIVKVKL